MGAFWWKNNAKPLIGATCRNFEDIEAFASMPEFDILELKVATLAKNGFPLYYLYNGYYFPLIENVKLLKEALRDKSYQVHMPYEGGYKLPGEKELLHSKKEDHDMLIDRQRIIAEIFNLTENCGICVWHPAAIMIKGKKIASLEETYEVASLLYKELDNLVFWEKWPVQITFENMAGPKKSDEALGYSETHLWKLFGQTRRIGITIDTGHGNLAPEDFHFRMFMGSGLPVCSIHWHGNEGDFDPDSYDDDQHEFATPKNVRGYHRWLALFKRMGLPVILELKKEYAREEIQEYARTLRTELHI